MTKPKITNGNCLNPVNRLEKRIEEYKRRHETASPMCMNIQESHNRSNDALKTLLERKSKLLESKTKKKRSTITASVNRKKPKLNQDPVPPSNNFLDKSLEVNQNVTLNVNTSDIPDIDWDNLDILNNPNFSMSINEHELDGVFNNCYSHSSQQPTELKMSPLQQHHHTNPNQINAQKISSNIKNDDFFFQNPVIGLKNDNQAFPPLFPSPEENPIPIYPQDIGKFDFVAPMNYQSNQYNSTGTVLPQTVAQPYNNNNIYSMNLPHGNSINNNLSYQYHNPLIVSDQIVGTNNNTNNNSYFYQYQNYGAINQQTVNNDDNFQLPSMSTGWYNSNVNVTCQSMKPTTGKRQQPHFVTNTNPSTMTTYRTPNYPQYLTGSQVQYQPTFNSQSYDHNNVTAANYPMITEQHTQQPYYYVDYPINSTAINHNRNIIDQNDIGFQASQQTNPILCRNVIYQ